MGSKKAPKNTTTTVKQEADPTQAAYLNAMLPYLTGSAQAVKQNVYERPQSYYPGSTVSQLSPSTYRYLQELGSYGGNKRPGEAELGNQLRETLRGDYLSGGPGFEAAQGAAARQIIPQVESRFSGAGRLDSGLARVAETQALSDSFAGLYNQERSRQLAAGGLVPTLAGVEQGRLSALGEVGQAVDTQAQKKLNDQVARWNFQQQEPAQRAQAYRAGVAGTTLPFSAGTTTTTAPNTQATTSSSGLNALGGGILGYQAGSALPTSWGGPVGAAGGALLGGLK